MICNDIHTRKYRPFGLNMCNHIYVGYLTLDNGVPRPISNVSNDQRQVLN